VKRELQEEGVQGVQGGGAAKRRAGEWARRRKGASAGAMLDAFTNHVFIGFSGDASNSPVRPYAHSPFRCPASSYSLDSYLFVLLRFSRAI
jgi:hypothetical protein